MSSSVSRAPRPFPPGWRTATFRFAFFFFNDTATTDIYTLSLHDALPISAPAGNSVCRHSCSSRVFRPGCGDRKSTRLNSSHVEISYAVFCLKKNNELVRRERILLRTGQERGQRHRADPAHGHELDLRAAHNQGRQGIARGRGRAEIA